MLTKQYLLRVAATLLLVEKVDLLLRAFEQSLEEHLLVNDVFNRLVHLLLAVRGEPTLLNRVFLGLHLFAETTEEFAPKAQVPRIKRADRCDS